MARIAIDCDGVLANFAAAFIDLLHRHNPVHPLTEENWVSWEYGGLVSKTDEKKVWHDIKASENFWLGLNAYDGVGDLAIWLASRAGHDIWICTSRCPTAGLTTTKQTEIWLASCGLRGVNNFLGVVTIPDSDKKADFYKAARIEYSLDDRWETVVDCGLIDTFEHKAYLLTQPWNAEASVYHRVSSVDEFLRRIG